MTGKRLKEHILRFVFYGGVLCIYLIFMYITSKNPFPVIFPFAGFVFSIMVVWKLLSDIKEYFDTGREMRAREEMLVNTEV